LVVTGFSSPIRVRTSDPWLAFRLPVNALIELGIKPALDSSLDKRAAWQEIEERITLFAAALETASDGEEQTQTNPENRPQITGLEQSKSAVLNSLKSASSKRSYDHAIREFIDWYCSEPRLTFNRTAAAGFKGAVGRV